jgi:hypothetical protein
MDSTPQGAERVLGFIAQSVQRIAPELVTEDRDTGILAVEYTSVVPLLIEILKQHEKNAKHLSEQLVADLDESARSIRKTLRNLKKIRREMESKSSPEPPSPPSIEKNRVRKSTDKASTWPLFGCISKPLFVILAAGVATLLVVAIILAAVLATHTASNSPQSTSQNSPPFVSTPSTPRAPAALGWRQENYIPNGGFEDPDPADPSKTQGITGNYSLYSYTAKRRDVMGVFPLVDNATLYFPAGNRAAKVYIDPVYAQNTPIYQPATISALVNVELTLVNTTGFANASSGVSGMNITTWFNWMYCEDVPASQPLNRTQQNAWLLINYFTGVATPNVTLGREQRANLTAAPNKGWAPLWVYVPFDQQNFPTRLTINLRSTLRGVMFWDYVRAQFIF